MRLRESLRVALVAGAATAAVAVAAGLWAHNSAIQVSLVGLVIPVILLVRDEVERHSLIHRRDSVEVAATAVAEKARTYWNHELGRRRLYDIGMMPSRWRRSAVRASHTQHLPAEGNINALIAGYHKAPQRLVMLGEPGSGKTAFCLALTLALLEEKTPARIPVVLQLASWNRDEDLNAWIAGQLRTMHGIPLSTALELVEEHRILPILDGLDEGPDKSIRQTLRALDSRLSTGPFVLTCREKDFDDADAEHLISRDTEVRILPLAPDEIADVLERAADGQRRWTSVIAAVRDRPDHPIATALNTRLMLFLIIRAYDHSDEKPADLLDPDRFGTVELIHDHLIDLFLAKAFSTAPAGRRYHRSDVVKWLQFVAARLRNDSDRRLSWWRFSDALAGTVLFTIVRISTGIAITSALCLMMFGLFGHPVAGIVVGSVIGLLGGLVLGLLPRPSEPRALPRALRSNFEGLAPAIVFAIVAGLGSGVTIGLIYQSIVVGVTDGIVVGLGFGVTRRRLTTEPARTARVLSPDQVLRDDRRTVIEAFLLGGVVAAAVGAGLGLLGRARDLGFIIPLHGRLEEVLWCAAIGLVAGSFGLAMMFQATSAWGRLVLTRIVLAWRGETPLRLMRFLHAAEDAGVLRRLGPQYEFRNELFRIRLAALADARVPSQAVSPTSTMTSV